MKIFRSTALVVFLVMGLVALAVGANTASAQAGTKIGVFDPNKLLTNRQLRRAMECAWYQRPTAQSSEACA